MSGKKTWEPYSIYENYLADHPEVNASTLSLRLGCSYGVASYWKKRGEIPRTIALALRALNGTTQADLPLPKDVKPKTSTSLPPAPTQVQPKKKTVVLKGPVKTIDLLTELGQDQGCEVIEF